ncbi:NLP/P60 family protein, putative [Trichomonas vaginalis G3]|uniref:NLP/P60 family protein, putative n=1 Tax=Trichomonas vaginalis (strain ATCC PRA-98 / G3) TaxID=412133 RepID=A2FFA9_TRIV3|nr:bacterial SH3 domain-like protein [Trichomonas vaginalis G3]EAX96401.1 NLP/P60 family protein, putative [Trichomonas vaginalis G3]KAI5514558.1 bacterial SH3 domain-like protein [Trichomonas vaginalis G3]|eukprot:XP_001309331.1 NLP/P60 family protein [Trichomonas vaginalis G3]
MIGLLFALALSRVSHHHHSYRRHRMYETNGAGSGVVYGSGIGVNIRSGPGTGYGVIAAVADGTTLSVTGHSSNWWQVSYNGQTGYVISDYLKVSGSVSGTGSGLNVRAGPGTNYAVVAGLSDGTSVTITGINGDWYHISQGYVYSQYISLTSSGTSGGGGGSSGVVIRQGDARFNSNIRTWGCAFMSICWCEGVNSIDGCNAKYNQAVAAGWMSASCYINNWDSMKTIAGAKTYRYGAQWATAASNEKEILQCANSRTTMHFVVGNKNNGIEYDPAYDGFVSYSDHQSKRFYGY